MWYKIDLHRDARTNVKGMLEAHIRERLSGGGWDQKLFD